MVAHFKDTWIIEGIIHYDVMTVFQTLADKRKRRLLAAKKYDRFKLYFYACVQANIQLVQADLSFGQEC